MSFKVGEWIVGKEEVLEKFNTNPSKKYFQATIKYLQQPVKITSLEVNTRRRVVGWVEVELKNGYKEEVFTDNYRLATENEIKSKKIKDIFSQK